MQCRGMWTLSSPEDALVYRSSAVLYFSKLPSSLPILYRYCIVACMASILRLVLLPVISIYNSITAPGQEDLSSSLFKCFWGIFKQGDQSERSTSITDSFQCQKVSLTAYTLPCAAGSPDNMIQKQETQTLVLCTHKSRFIFPFKK